MNLSLIKMIAFAGLVAVVPLSGRCTHAVETQQMSDNQQGYEVVDQPQDKVTPTATNKAKNLASGCYMGQLGDADCEILVYGKKGEYVVKKGKDKVDGTLKKVSPGIYEAYRDGKLVGTFKGELVNGGDYEGTFVGADGSNTPFFLRLEGVFNEQGRD